MMFGLPMKATIIGVAVLISIATLGLYSRWIYNRGADNERRIQVEKSLGRTAQRNKDDEDLRNTDLDGLCREYGATRWVPARQGCE